MAEGIKTMHGFTGEDVIKTMYQKPPNYIQI